MNSSLEKLYGIAQKETRHILGLMSGTSLDGLDIALCAISGHGLSTSLSIKKFTTIVYDDDFRKEVQELFAQKNVSLEKLCLVNEWIGKQHAIMINQCLSDWQIAASEIDLVASHGQTIYHAPIQQHKQQKFGNGTLQIGDADHIAVGTGIICVSDFRQKHIAAGGEGAPLAAYGDYLLFAEKNKDVVLLNIGGIANFTWLPAGKPFSEIVSSDTGPGNTMMNAYIASIKPGSQFDEDAAMASQGTIHEKLLHALMEHEFFRLPFPKTTGPELFNISYLQSALGDINLPALPGYDILATLNRFTAESIGIAIKQTLPKLENCIIYASGGGIHNPLLMDHLKKIVYPASLCTTREKQIDPDAKEAVLFAILANECIAGNADSFGKGSTHSPAIGMGKISFPT